MSVASNKEELKSDLSSIVRVRNRFAGIGLDDHEKFTFVTTGLLPRLLRRLDRNDRQEVVAECQEIKTQIRDNLTGLLSHILERIRLMGNALSTNVPNHSSPSVSVLPSPQNWIDSTISVLNDLNGMLAQTMALSIIQAGFMFLEQWKRLSMEHCGAQKPKHGKLLPYEQSFSRLDSLAKYLDTAHHKIIQLEENLQNAVQSSNSDLFEQREQTRLRQQINLIQTQCRTSGWLLLHELQYFHEVSKDFSSSLGVALLERAGVFSLLLDFFLFKPQHNYNSQSEMNTTGLTRNGLILMQHQPAHVNELLTAKQSSSLALSSPVARFRQWKWNCMELILKRDMSHDDRKLVLAIVCSNPHSMDGKAAMSWLENHTSSFLCTSKRQNLSSLQIVLPLFTLLLGHASTNEILTVLTENSNKSKFNVWMHALGLNAVNCPSLSRMPLPQIHSSSVVMYLERYMDQSVLVGSPDFGSESTNDVTRLILRLIAEVRKIEITWALRLMQPLIIPRVTPSAQLPSFVDINDTKWKNDLYDQCMGIAHSILLSIPQRDSLVEEARAVAFGLQPIQENDLQPLGVPRAPARRGDVNRLLLEHRAQKRQIQLHSISARESRQIAYRIISHFVRESSIPREKVIDLARLLFQCVSFEQHDDLKKAVNSCLDNILDVFQQSIEDLDDKQRHCALAPLLPSLLCVVTTHHPESLALQSVVIWCERLVSPIDPASAHHICDFLARPIHGEDEVVQRAAKRACLGLRHSILSSNLQSNTAISDTNTRRNVRFCDSNSPECTLLIMEELHRRTKKMVPEATSNGNDDDALLCLISNRFNVDLAVRAFKRETDGHSSGLLFAKDNSDDEQIFHCPICYDGVVLHRTMALSCDHRFCMDCWGSFGRTLTKGHDLLHATCPSHNCQVRVGPSVLEIVQPGLQAQFDDALVKYFVQIDSHFLQCPGIDCNQVAFVQVSSSEPLRQTLPYITCSQCSTHFCSGCGEEEIHLPACCNEVAKWKRLLAKSSFWIKKNSKPCPGCSIPTAKVSGCNNMTCSQCTQEWCWICCARLNSHLEPHVCNKFDPAENDNERRALFFTDRFLAHEQAEGSMRDKREKLSGSSIDPYWIRLGYSRDEEVASLRSAVDMVIRSRAFLKYSYIACFASPGIGELFDAQQGTLELLTERLSRLIFTNLHKLNEGDRGFKRFLHVMEFEVNSMLLSK